MQYIMKNNSPVILGNFTFDPLGTLQAWIDPGFYSPAPGQYAVYSTDRYGILKMNGVDYIPLVT
jgi:hypothetical protein